MSKLTKRILFLKFVCIREFQESLKFIKFEFLIYGQNVYKLTSEQSVFARHCHGTAATALISI